MEPCGQLSRPGERCNAPATCRGSDGTCFACRCLIEGTSIATPSGPVNIAAVDVGTIVWTVDRDGRRIAAPVIARVRREVLGQHHIVKLVLADGRALRASGVHPTSDGRTLGALRVGDELDGSWVVTRADEPYDGEALFDLRPAGATGSYLADGILIGSTLAGE